MQPTDKRIHPVPYNHPNVNVNEWPSKTPQNSSVTQTHYSHSAVLPNHSFPTVQAIDQLGQQFLSSQISTPTHSYNSSFPPVVHVPANPILTTNHPHDSFPSVVRAPANPLVNQGTQIFSVDKNRISHPNTNSNTNNGPHLFQVVKDRQ